jgi:hyperosmotically inducible protein
MIMIRSAIAIAAILAIQGAEAKEKQQQQVPSLGLSQWGPVDVSRWYPFGESVTERSIHWALLRLPFFGVFDHLSYRFDGVCVFLYGWVLNPNLRNDAEIVVRNVPGVQGVSNEINYLPNSPADNRIRIAVFRAIYADPRLGHYAFVSNGAIHIVVRQGSVWLEGEVADETDRLWAASLAKVTRGVLAVTNHLTATPD